MVASFDVVVLGSGMAGSVLALILQRVGIKTLCIERKAHPRFAIGESTVPTMSFLLKQLARDYDVPEVGEVAHYLGLRKNGCAAWPKQGFWHGVHREGEPLEPHRELFFETVLLPLGPDVHLLRADADAFLVSRFASYGVEYEDNAELLSYETLPSQEVELSFRGPGGVKRVRTRFVVDATGHASYLAKRFGLRDERPRLATNTRSIFSHFTDVPPLDEIYGGHNPAFRFRRDSGTMHHMFRGGWIWVIPFDNGVTSVGIDLDRRMYPLDDRVSPEAEIAAVIERYPSVGEHLGSMKPVRSINRSDRIQFTSRTILGDGFILTPHASAFVGPLYSTGFLLTALFISRFIPEALAAKAAGNWQSDRFSALERTFFAELTQIDRIVNGSIHSFRNHELYKQYWRNWVLASAMHLGTCVLVGRAPPARPVFWGAGLPEFSAHVARMHDAICASQTEADDLRLAARMRDESERWWEGFAAGLLVCNDDRVGARIGTDVSGTRDVNLNYAWLEKLFGRLETATPDMTLRAAGQWIKRAVNVGAEQIEQYHRSKREGTDYHLAFERILRQDNPARFSYRREMGLE